MDLDDLKIPMDVEPPLICFPSKVDDSDISGLLCDLKLQQSVKDLMLDFFHAGGEDIEGFKYSSAKQVSNDKSVSRTWRDRVLKKLTESGLLIKKSYDRPGRGKKPVIYIFSSTQNVDSSSKGSGISLSEKKPTSESIGVVASDNYLVNRPATIIELAAFIMDALPRAPISGRSHMSESRFQGHDVKTSMNVLSGKKSAYEGDIRTLIALCTFIEDEFLGEMLRINSVDVTLEGVFDMDVTTIVKYLNGKNDDGTFKYGAGYNNVAIDSMMRLSSINIDIEREFQDAEYRNEPNIQPLSNTIPYSKGGRQRIQFQLAPVIMNVLRMSAASTFSKTDNINSKQINNMVIQLGGSELGRVFLRIYCVLTQNEKMEFLPWELLIKWKNKTSTKAAFILNLKSAIKKMGTKKEIYISSDKPVTAYSVMGLLVTIDNLGLSALIESNYDAQSLINIRKLR